MEVNHVMTSGDEGGGESCDEGDGGNKMKVLKMLKMG